MHSRTVGFIGGGRITEVLGRLDGYFLNEPRPTWILVSLGINDVWHGGSGKDRPHQFARAYFVNSLYTQMWGALDQLLRRKDLHRRHASGDPRIAALEH